LTERGWQYRNTILSGPDAMATDGNFRIQYRAYIAFDFHANGRLLWHLRQRRCGYED
jgi:hypothetical protein